MKKTVLGITLMLVLIMIAVNIYAKTKIWACSNHTPAHTATSTAQVQDLTNRYGCQGWHVLN